MYLSELNAFIKHLSKNKLYTIVTILGFSISLMFVVLLSVYIKQELSFDKFHVKKDRLYRLTNENESNFSPPIGEWIQSTFPEVASYTRLFDQEGIISILQGEKYKFKYLMADSSFFTMFSSTD